MQFIFRSTRIKTRKLDVTIGRKADNSEAIAALFWIITILSRTVAALRATLADERKAHKAELKAIADQRDAAITEQDALRRTLRRTRIALILISIFAMLCAGVVIALSEVHNQDVRERTTISQQQQAGFKAIEAKLASDQKLDAADLNAIKTMLKDPNSGLKAIEAKLTSGQKLDATELKAIEDKVDAANGKLDDIVEDHGRP